MKCVDCLDYKACSRQSDLRKKRHKCKKANEPFVQTNADRIRAMSDEELARFAADRQANETYMRLTADRYTPSEAILKATREILYCKYLYWLRQPVKDGDN